MNAVTGHSAPAQASAVDCIVVGAGHAGLAMSRCLQECELEHVVLERGEIANSWRTERWDSLRLLTPNWLTRLPGHAYHGDDPHGFMTMPEVIEFIDGYARRNAAPVLTGTTVTSVRAEADRYRITTDRGDWLARTLVLASGACNMPLLPACARTLPDSIASVTPDRYRNPAQLDPGDVLVVGASATGLQLADEIHRSGRDVTLAIGEHIRLPRVYRGRDIQYWMARLGLFDERFDTVDDIVRARRVPSPQLIGTPQRTTLDVNALRDRGVRCVGRLVGIDGRHAHFSGSLASHCAMADLKMNRLLARIDASLAEHPDDAPVAAPDRFDATRIDAKPCLKLALNDIRTVVWATGYRADYSWLDVPVLDRRGRLRHDGGVVAAPGLYAMGLTFMRRRKSSFLFGAEDDARELSAHLANHLNASQTRRVA
jgi:putative flavoprotein involved in K+ transport